MSEDRRFDMRPRVRLNRLPPNPEEARGSSVVGSGRFPSWLHRRLPKGGNLWKTDQILAENRLHTVCEEASCPNMLECWSRKTATFLVMGRECTRACGFCDISHAKNPLPLESSEPERIAHSVKQLGLRHVVITMVARDDLPDGGAAHLALILRTVKATCQGVTLEVLTSDFDGNWTALHEVLREEPLVFNHNVETVETLTPRVRHKATYRRSLELLQYVHDHGKQRYLKSGLMVGLGESAEQVQATLTDLHVVGCDVVTIGQYLQPSRHKLTVKAFITPETFDAYTAFGQSLGIPHVYAGPFIRSSYNADLVANRSNANG